MQGEFSVAWTDDTCDVLVVDDDEGNRLGMLELLSAEGYRVQTAASAEAALLALRRVPARLGGTPRVILLDLVLPGMSGLALIRALDDDPRTAGIPILLTWRPRPSSSGRPARCGRLPCS